MAGSSNKERGWLPHVLIPSSPAQTGCTENAEGPPPVIAALDGMMVAEAIRQVAPACAGASHPQQGVNEQPVVTAWPALALAPAWNQMTQALPLVVTQPVNVAARHGRTSKSALNHVRRRIGTPIIEIVTTA